MGVERRRLGMELVRGLAGLGWFLCWRLVGPSEARQQVHNLAEQQDGGKDTCRLARNFLQ